MLFGHFVPVAKGAFKREQVELGQLLHILGLRFGGDGAVEVFASNVLALVGVEVVQVSLGHFACAFAFHVFVDYGHRWLSQDADGWVNDVHLVAKFFF